MKKIVIATLILLGISNLALANTDEFSTGLENDQFYNAKEKLEDKLEIVNLNNLESDNQKLVENASQDKLNKLEDQQQKIDDKALDLVDEYSDRINDEQKQSIQATSSNPDNKCAIWLCLPTGFPKGCSGAKREAIRRIRHHKSPLPPLSPCLASSNLTSFKGSNISSNEGIAAYIPANAYCEKTECVKYGVGQYSNTCVQTKCIKYNDEAYVRGTPCVRDTRGKSTPKGCTATLNWVEVTVDEQVMGATFYYK